MRINEFLNRLSGVEEVKENQWVGSCPAHDDQRPSLGVKQGDDGRTLLHCLAGCTTASILQALDLDWKDLFPTTHERVRPKRNIDRLWKRYCVLRDRVYGKPRVPDHEMRQWSSVSRAWENAMVHGATLTDENERKEMRSLWRLKKEGERKAGRFL